MGWGRLKIKRLEDGPEEIIQDTLHKDKEIIAENSPDLFDKGNMSQIQRG